MRIGFSLPQLGKQATPENLVAVAERAEALGYHSLWVLERLLFPTNPREPYPATEDGKLPETYRNVLDPIETLTFVAAHTKKVRLGSSVLVLPYHTPVILGRRLATLDVLSGGRVDVGIGAGWSTDEFEAANVPFANRGARTEELLQALIAVWGKDPVAFKGRFYSIPESVIGPKPIQKPYPPIYVAGFGRHALERAVKYGVGWNPSGVPAFEWLEDMIGQLKEIAHTAGRDRVEVALRVFPVIFEKSRGAERRPLQGTVEEIKADLVRLKNAGVTELIYSVPEIGWVDTPEIAPGLARMEQLIEMTP